MKTLRDVIANAKEKGIAIGHFNISELTALKAVFEAARELGLPVIIGTSEGERAFLGTHAAAALVKSLREEFDYPIFLNADHTHSFEKAVEAAKAGYDAVLFDGGALPWEDNIAQTKRIVEELKKINPQIIIEGEIGYIGTSSEIFKELPKGAAIRPEDLTTPDQAKEFAQKTGVDLLAPAVGNVHGMFEGAPNPALDIARIAAINEAAGVPLVLHGGSGTSDGDFVAAIKAGVSIVHINTEIRLAWRHGLEEGLKANPTTVAPYKILPGAVAAVKAVVKNRLALFSDLSP